MQEFKFIKLGWLVKQLILTLMLIANVRGDLLGPSQKQEMSLSDEESEEFEKFKQHALPTAPVEWMKLDIALHKYFAAGDKNADNALAIWNDSNKLRKDFDGYILSEEEQRIWEALIPIHWGEDKLGRVVLSWAGNKLNLTHIFSDETLASRYLHGLWWISEQTCQRLVVGIEGRKAAGSVVLMDAHAADLQILFSPRAFDALKTYATEWNKRFPRVTQLYVIINAPPGFDMYMNTIKNLAGKYMSSILRVYGENDKVWVKDLQQFLEIDKFPELYIRSQDPEAGKFGSMSVPDGVPNAESVPAMPMKMPSSGMGSHSVGGRAIKNENLFGMG